MICRTLFVIALGVLFWMLHQLDREDPEDDSLY